MTWDSMVTEVKKLKGLLTNDKNEVIGFTVSGMTYDGDGNCQDDSGTDMEMVFDSTDKMKTMLNKIVGDIIMSENCKK